MRSVFLIEFIVFFGAALAWAAWELWSVRRSKFADPSTQDSAVPSKELPRHPER